MKYLIVIISLLFLIKNTTAQINTETQDLYLKSFERYIAEFDVYKEKGIGILKPEKIFFIEGNLLDSIPQSIKGVDLIEINSINYKTFFKTKNTKLSCIHFEPIQIIKNEILITVISSTRSYNSRNSHWTITYGSWFNVFFEFDSTTQKWKISKTELKGI